MDDEILVHISDPVTVQNDALYRSLANAYLDFEPHRVSFNENTTQGIDAIADEVPSNISNQLCQTTTSVLSGSRDSYGSFPTYVNMGDDNDVYNRADQSIIPASQETMPTPISNRLVRLERLQTVWKAQSTPESSFVSNNKNPQTSPDYFEDGDTTFLEDTQLAYSALQSQLPTGPSVVADGLSQVGSALGPRNSSPVDISFDQDRIELESSRSDLLAASTPTSINDERAQIESSNAQTRSHPVSSKNYAYSSDPHSASKVDFAALESSILPPAPEVSIVQPQTLPTQITGYLAELLLKNPARFSASKQSSMPGFDERGCWAIECTTWERKAQLEFWNSLKQHVLSGRLGWGTTLHRENGSKRNLGLVKLYCWGEIVEHIWLVLWLSSRGAIINNGTKWLNADGVATIWGPSKSQLG